MFKSASEVGGSASSDANLAILLLDLATFFKQQLTNLATFKKCIWNF
jgi:hypothetical protein